METRSKGATPKLSDAEVEILQRRNQETQAKLLAETQALREERAQFEREQNEARRALQESQAAMETQRGNSRKWEEESSRYDETIDKLRRELDEIRRATRQAPAAAATPTSRNISFTQDPRSPDDESSIPRISFREALETIPSFDGYNMPVAQFARACRRARELFPAQSERSLTKLICNKLRNRAAAAVEDEPCSSITQLIDLLNGAFGSLKTVDQYRGELSMMYIKPNEHILDYISRAKDLRSSIIDLMRREGIDIPSRLAEVEQLTTRSFCDGLPLPYRLQMHPERYINPFEAFSAAKAIARRQELDNQRFDKTRPPSQPNNYRGPPQARTPPHRYERDNRQYERDNRQYERDNRQPPRYEPPQRSPNSSRDWNANRPQRRDESSSARPAYRAPPNAPRREEKWCRYCKISGHEIEECRKRQYNNNARQQGNGNTPSRSTGEPRAEPSRPQRTINVITASPAAENNESSE